MSCHTWCAYKVERSIEEARRLWIFQQEKFIDSWKKMVDNPEDEFRTRLKHSQDYMDHYLKVCERQLRMVKNDLCNVAVMNKQPEHSYYIPGKGFFVNSEEFGNPFRIGDSDEQIFSKEECLQFIEKNKEKIAFDENTYEQLDEFWNRYPDGYMHFG